MNQESMNTEIAVMKNDIHYIKEKLDAFVAAADVRYATKAELASTRHDVQMIRNAIDRTGSRGWDLMVKIAPHILYLALIGYLYLNGLA